MVKIKQLGSGTVSPTVSRKVPNESFLSENNYNHLQNITSAQLKKTAHKYESQGRGRATPKAVVLGDSPLIFAGEECKKKGYDVHCFPGNQDRRNMPPSGEE
jgi:hypothetical protein